MAKCICRSVIRIKPSSDPSLIDLVTMSLANKNILLGVSGGIAAYKSAELVRELIRAHANVRVVMTRSAKEFVTPRTFQALSGNSVLSDEFEHTESANGMDHIALSRWADAVLIAPASANTIAKLTHGGADDLLSTTCLATKAPIAPCSCNESSHVGKSCNAR